MTRYWRPSLIVLFCLALNPFPAYGQTRPKIVIGYASMSSVATTLWVTQEKGFFAKNGLDVQTVFIPGSPTLIATLNSGDVQFGYTGGTATLGSAVGGLDLKMIAAFANRVQTDLVVRPEIKTPVDLKGKRLGVTSIGGSGWMSAMLGLEQLGLNPERDQISLSAFGDQRVISQAVEQGTINGAAIAGVFSRRLKRSGYNILGDLEKIPLVGTSIVVKTDYLNTQTSTARNTLKALIEGHAYVLNPANRASVLEIMVKRLGLSDATMASDGLDDYVKRVDRKPYVSIEGLRNIQRFMKLRNPKIAEVKLERLIDDSILRELDKSGFIDQVYAAKPAPR
jgi:ABC-type nitrate/sulfonate/bicarbonate transport system substrate-binding protein